MNKFAKYSLITAGIMFITGIIICAICASLGSRSLMHKLITEGEFLFEDIHFTNHITTDTDLGWEFNLAYPHYSGSHEDHNAAIADDIKNLSISLGGGSLYVEESDDSYFHIRSEHARKYQYYTQNDTFYITGFQSTDFDDNNKIYLEIPSGKYFDDITIELGAGNITFYQLLGNTAAMEIGAGRLTCNSLSVDNLSTEIGAGAMEVKNASVQNASFEIGVGRLSYHGEITGALDAECIMGSLDMHLKGHKKAHNYEIDYSMGNINIGGSSYTGIGYETSIDNEANSTYTLSCSMGNITISFEE